MSLTDEVLDTVAELRETVANLHGELTRNALVIWTAGNVSARVPGRELMVIKPSGVSYDDLSADTMVVTDLHGELVHGELAPSSDTAAHAYVYRHLPEIGGVVHTHSTYATAWAARGEPIPCVLTMIADEFGGEIPVGPVRPDRRRLHRPRHRRNAPHQPLQGRADAQPRPVHRRPHRARRGQGRGDGRGRRPHRAQGLRAGHARTPPPEDVDRLYARYQNVYGQH